jgi:hypothetical protein
MKSTMAFLSGMAQAKTLFSEFHFEVASGRV